MKLPTKTIEKKLFQSGYRLIYAVDEVGMGCLAGPVVVCAVGITNTFYKKHHKKPRWLRDSKLLAPNQREKLANELLNLKNFAYALAYCHSKTVDKLNIYNASRLAMRNAVKILKPNFNIKSIILVDGRSKIRGLNIEQMPIVKGDRKVFAIACASIIAKVYRDKVMTRYAKKYPGYGFEKHKGYGTKYHRTRLTSLGPCAIHRKSFRLDY